MLKSLGRFRLITFDVTNTLLQFRTSPGKQYGEVGALFGARCDNNELAKNFKANWYKLNCLQPNFGRNSNISYQKWWRQLIADTFAESGAAISEAKLDNFANHLVELYKTSICWQHCNGSLDLLRQLKRLNNDATGRVLKLGIIANFDPRLTILLRNMKIEGYFDIVLNSYDANVEKPAAEIFKMAMRTSKLDNLQPGECLHIGDGPTTDYLAAKALGWHAALIHEKSSAYLTQKYGDKLQAQHVFPSLYDFQKKLADDVIEW